MAERANDEILQLAEQGNLQALSVYLNRHLIPNGAHVKVKQKEDSLHVLIVVMRESDNKELLSSVQQHLTRLHPDNIKRVRLYTQVLGQKQSTLRQQFSISRAEPHSEKSHSEKSHSEKLIFPEPVISPQQPIALEQSVAAEQLVAVERRAPLSTTAVASSNPQSIDPVPVSFTPSVVTAQRPQPSPSLTPTRKDRYSVAEFLSQATSLEELKVLHNHPFFTGVCPQCRGVFQVVESPPIYWDCPKCHWQDDLSTILPLDKIRNSSRQPSLTESKRLGDYLVEAGLLTHAQIGVALQDQLSADLKFGEVLVRRGWIKEETVEYLMQKVILPERAGLYQNASSYLESSRNLLKALLKNHPADPQSPNTPPPKPPAAHPPVLSPQSPSEPPKPRYQKVMPSNLGKLANERETLILPDLDISEYLKDA